MHANFMKFSENYFGALSMSQAPKVTAALSLMKWLLAIVMTGVVTVLLLFLAGVFHSKVPSEVGATTPRSAEGLKSGAARLLKRPRYETATGTVKPVHESAVAAKLLAKVLEINAIAGQVVQKDQVLVKLDDADLQARLKQAEAGLTSAQVRSEQTKTEFGRAEQLKAKKAISQADFDTAQAAMKSAAAELERATQAVMESQVMLEYATIRSPMSGTIIDKRVEVGDTVSPGQILLTLFDPTHMQMVASVRESLAMKLKPGQLLPTRLDALDFDCEATISEVVPESDVASRSFTVKVTGPCPPGVYSGMFGRLMVPLDEEEVLVIPVAAVRKVGQLTMVDVVSDNSLSRRNVRLGRTLELDVEVLAGLVEGELVVVE
ncbi:MAG: efflux RND transporter periplasmic adaptor subunit [Planctomycetota bacterium]|nr:MAG: efflux RND transporter periplasmic adaptor subunit [Planctomycetota bacterium]